jgi:hypothetical protein
MSRTDAVAAFRDSLARERKRTVEVLYALGFTEIILFYMGLITWKYAGLEAAIPAFVLAIAGLRLFMVALLSPYKATRMLRHGLCLCAATALLTPWRVILTDGTALFVFVSLVNIAMILMSSLHKPLESRRDAALPTSPP